MEEESSHEARANIHWHTIRRSGVVEVHRRVLHDKLRAAEDIRRPVVHAFHAVEVIHSEAAWSDNHRAGGGECGDVRNHDAGYSLEEDHDVRNTDPVARIRHGVVENASDLDARNKEFRAAPTCSVS